MIHGGGHMTLSRKAIPEPHIEFLLSRGFLPISPDYRLCPQVNLVAGPLMDIRDACIWTRKHLPQLLQPLGINVASDDLVVVGWSSGGHLAMTTAWTLEEAGFQPPKSILSFDSPTDFESGGKLRDEIIHEIYTIADIIPRPRSQ
jgi:acetyl esterase/lipase